DRRGAGADGTPRRVVRDLPGAVLLVEDRASFLAGRRELGGPVDRHPSAARGVSRWRTGAASRLRTAAPARGEAQRVRAPPPRSLGCPASTTRTRRRPPPGNGAASRGRGERHRRRAVRPPRRAGSTAAG